MFDNKVDFCLATTGNGSGSDTRMSPLASDMTLQAFPANDDIYPHEDSCGMVAYIHQIVSFIRFQHKCFRKKH